MKTRKVDKYIFFDESGTGGDSSYLALGVVVCKHPSKLHEKFDQLRKKYEYYNEIKFEKMSRKRHKIYRAFLKVFEDSENVYFRAVVINKRKVGIKHFGHKRWARFNTLADDLINSVVKESESVKVIADERTSPAEDNFSEYLLTHVIGAQEVVLVNSKDYDLIQICDLILGAVRASFEKVVKSELKLEVIDEVLNFSKEKVAYYEYKIESGQLSETESGRNS